MVNSRKIKSRLVELGLTQKDIAASLKLSAPTVSQKINNVRPFFLNEADELARILEIPVNQFGDYFFYHSIA